MRIRGDGTAKNAEAGPDGGDGDRKPSEISGGQPTARGAGPAPLRPRNRACLLLDEPLSALEPETAQKEMADELEALADEQGSFCLCEPAFGRSPDHVGSHRGDVRAGRILQLGLAA